MATCLLAAALVLPGALLLSAEGAEAQTAVKLVGTIGQSTSSTPSSLGEDQAQAFTTGSNPAGYTLTRVVWEVSGTGSGAVSATIRRNLNLSDNAGLVGTLRSPASLGANSSFTATGSGIDLDNNTTYWVVFDSSGGSRQVRLTASNAEDSGAAAGWSIADTSRYRNAGSTGAWTTSFFTRKIAIHGVVNPGVPAAPAAPTLSGTDGTSLTITWTAVAAAGAAVTDYDVRYRRKGDTAWIDHPHDGTALTATINNLLQGASWEAQVAASNANGPGRWSATGSGHTGPARFVRAETSPSGRNINLTFTKDLKAGTSGSTSAYVVRRSGVDKIPSVVALSNDNSRLIVRLSAANVVLAAETVSASYTKPASGTKLADADNLEIASFSGKPVTNRVPAAAATAPAAPAAPTVSAVSSSRNLSVSWTAPTDTGSSAISDYELRYYEGGSDPSDESDWVRQNEASGLPDPGTSTSATISGLKAGTAYRVQVRAENGTGWGPWSSSGSATTNAASGTNNAPTRATLSSTNCVEKTADTSYDTLAVTIGTLKSLGPVVSQTRCTGSNRKAPMFRDPDGDTLTVTARIESLPDNVRLGDVIPFVRLGSTDKVFFHAIAAYRQTNVRVDVTATDPSGASVSTFFFGQATHLSNIVGAPAFAANPGPQRFALNQAIAPLVLPAATGGDVLISDAQGTYDLTYDYAVEGLPAGLTFDAATRTISGTPTALGTYTVTYTAEDGDGHASADRNPTTVAPSDTASLDFTIQVGNQPGIERVRIVSKPQFDSDGDGTADTYIRSAPIEIDVEFNEPVKVTGTGNVRMRLDLGTDDDTLTNSHKVVSATSSNLRHNGQTLRFVYNVGRNDRDADGVWVQARTVQGVPNTVLILSGATLTHAVTGEAADLTYGHLPTSGDPRHKVDGSKTSADIGPRPTGATVNGATLTVTFNGNLATPSAADLAALRYDLLVRGAGGIGADDRNDQQSPGAISVSGATLTLTLGAPARAGETVNVSYVGKTLKGAGAGGKRAAMFRGLAVTNNTPGTAGPAPLHASVEGRQLRMVFRAPLDTGSAPAGSAFTVEAVDPDGDERDIAGTGTATISGSVVTVTLASAMRADETGSVYYAKPSASPLRGSASGNPEVRSFERWRIASASDGVAPRLLGGAVVQTGTSPAQSKLALYFDEALSTFSVPAAGDFAVRVGEDAVTVSAAAVEGRSVVLTLDRLAAAGTAFEATYTPGTNRIRDWAGNAAAAFRQTVTAASSGEPVAQTAVAEGAKVVLTYDRPLDPASAPAAAAFTLHYKLIAGQTDADRVAYRTGVASVAVAGRTAVLHLDEPVFPCVGSNAFTVTYAVPGSSPLQGLDGTDAAAFANQAVTNGRTYRCNNSNWMHGARVGSVILTAKRPFATDVEPQASWFTVEASGGPVTVTGAAYSEDDEHELKLSIDRDLAPGEEVTVSYRRPEGAPGLWDADGNQLGDIVDRAVDNPAAGSGLTAAFSDVPAGHEGRGSEFSFELAFSENFAGKLDYKVLRDKAVQATNARVTGAARVTQGQNRRWTITVRPRSNEDVTVTLPATADCSAAGAICTPDGRKLSNTASATVALAPARLKSAATAESGRGLILTFTKDIKVGGAHTDYTVTVDGESRGTGGTSWEDDTVALVLAEPVRRGETVTVAYAKPADGVALRDADDVAIESFGPEAVTNTVPRSANAAATGAPTISGTAQVGETLTASTAGIADANGLTGAVYAWQWVAGGADIAGATNRTYTLADADAGKRIRVRVSFTDDDGYGETLTSAATAAVVPPLTASFHGMPAEHDGQKLFSFELRFSENFPGRFNYKVLRDEAFQVANGRVRGAKRVAPRQNQRWTISVRPSSHEAVTVTLPAGSVTTEAGRTLANTVTATVAGPALLAVADATASEGADAAVAFAVTLSREASGEVTVQYLTLDGTAKAGEDYTETKGTLTFAAGETEKTVSVPILDDALDEGEETFTLKLRNAKGAYIIDGEAVGTIENSDPLQKMWLSRFGRTVADHVTAAVSDRLATPLTGARVTVGGQSVDLAEMSDEARLGQTLTSIARIMGTPSGPAPTNDPGWGPGQDPGPVFPSGRAVAAPWPGTGLGGSPTLDGTTAREIAGRELLLGSAFHLAKEGDGGTPGLAAWGRVTVGGFDGEAPADDGSVRIDGEVTTGILGADAEWNRVLAGVAVSVSEGEGRFDQPGVDSGTIESTMTTVSPYARLSVNERISVWGLAGWGAGDMTIVQAANDATGQPERIARTDLSIRLAALGGRGALLTADEAGGFDLALKADGFYVETTSEAISNEGDTSADASRVRLVLEGSRAFQVGDGVLTPGLELGLRHDGGDAETGTGVELGGRVSYQDPATGLSVEAKARALVAHEDSKYREWGASGAVRLAPGERGRGLSFSLAPTWGAPSGGVDRLWSARDAQGLAPGSGTFEPESRLEGELGYGLPLFGDRFTGTPNVGFGLSGAGARDYRIGWRLTSAVPGDPGFEVTLDAVRREPANPGSGSGAGSGADTPVEHGVMLRAGIRW